MCVKKKNLKKMDTLINDCIRTLISILRANLSGRKLLSKIKSFFKHFNFGACLIFVRVNTISQSTGFAPRNFKSYTRSTCRISETIFK